MAPYVPTDIFEIIFDLLHDDKPTLAACTLVSSAWLPHSRFNLFRFLTYYAKQDGSGFTPFLDFLRSSPEHAYLIHKLLLGGFVEVGGRRGSYKHEILSYSTLLDILDSLPTLSDFELCHVEFPRPPDWTEEEQGRFEMGTRRELALHKLTLRAIGPLQAAGRPITRTYLSEFNGVLGVFSSVQELRVSGFSHSPINPDNYQARLGLRNPLYGQKQPLSLVARDDNYIDGIWDVIDSLSIPVRCFSLIGGDFGRVTKLKHLRLDFTYMFACEYYSDQNCE